MLPILFFLYFVALMTSMSGMELFGWLTALTSFVIFFRNRELRNSIYFVPGKWLIGFWVIVLLGLFLNDVPSSVRVDKGADMRWILLFVGLAIGWGAVGGPKEKSTKYFVGLIIIIGLYGIFQSLTGIDLLRETNRAVQPTRSWMYRAAGFLSSPMTYAQSFGMILNFLVAYILLYRFKSKAYKILNWICLLILSISLVMTFTRGVWIAATLSVLTVTFIVSRKKGALFLLLFIGLGTFGIAKSDALKNRILSLVDMNYTSNNDRLILWKTNFEIFKESPLLGVGYGENERRLGDFYEKLGIVHDFKGHAHNTYIHWLSGTGLIGLFFYLAIIAKMFMLTLAVYRSIPGEESWHRALIVGAIGAQVCFHVAGLFEANFEDAEVCHLLVFIWSIVVWLATQYPPKNENGFKPSLLEAS